jgi:hypothetical protein
MKLIIKNTEITRNENGLYSLNDLHRSSGLRVKDLPNKFMASKSFKNVVEVLNAQKSAFNPVEKKRGRYNGGTWICKELVYKYAMWVDAEFEVHVIQTFDGIINAINSPTTMKALNELTLKIESDSAIASKCGAALAHYKKVKKENTERWVNSVNEAQLKLGFS